MSPSDEQLLVLKDKMIEDLEEKLRVKELIIEKMGDFTPSLRDDVAVSVLPTMLSLQSLDYSTAIQESFRVADAFLRIKETGSASTEPLIEELKKTVNQYPNNAELGNVLREILKMEGDEDG